MVADQQPNVTTVNPETNNLWNLDQLSNPSTESTVESTMGVNTIGQLQAAAPVRPPRPRPRPRRRLTAATPPPSAHDARNSTAKLQPLRPHGVDAIQPGYPLPRTNNNQQQTHLHQRIKWGQITEPSQGPTESSDASTSIKYTSGVNARMQRVSTKNADPENCIFQRKPFKLKTLQPVN